MTTPAPVPTSDETPAAEGTEAVTPPTPAPVVETPAPVVETPAPAAPVVETVEDSEPVFTVAEFNTKVQERLGRLQKQHDKEMAAAKKEGGGEGLVAAETARQAAEAALVTTRVEYELELAMLKAKVPDDKKAIVLKLAELGDDAVVDGKPVREVFAAAVASVIAQVPGLVEAPTTPPAPAVPAGPTGAEPKKDKANSMEEAVVWAMGNKG